MSLCDSVNKKINFGKYLGSRMNVCVSRNVSMSPNEAVSKSMTILVQV